MAKAKHTVAQTTTFVVSSVVAQATPAVANAGMPTFTLTDVAKMRLSSISFFLLVALVSAIAIRWIWNQTRRDFSWMPHLSIKGAIGGVLLWGLVFVVVLTMISGARELMTPGAWQKNGLTYQLNDTQASTASAEDIAAEVTRQFDERLERTAQLERLFAAVSEFSDMHDGRLPTEDEFLSLPDELLRTSTGVHARYVYTPVDPSDSDAFDPVIVIEPDVFADGRQLSLHRSGRIQPVVNRETAE